MATIDSLLVELCAAALEGDKEAAAFLRMFAPWAAEQTVSAAEGHLATYPRERP
ncbi:hypothetical protein [Lysobacter sp. Root494]|uniref:hypothetical protein n=1 Tax=Lysobacter sp. Root494 TaxID=1736549 RepID=UPI000A91968B|nr:hypothetical protein [Lysobacter sp. Root494]